MKRRKEVKRKGKRTRDTHDPEILIPSALQEELSLPEGEAVGSRQAKTAYASRKEERKRRRKEKRRAGHEATQQWRDRRKQQSGPHVEQNGDNATSTDLKENENDAAVKPESADLKKPKQGKTKKRKRISGGIEGNSPQDDANRSVEPTIENPDAREVRRLEKLLGIDRKKRRKSSKGKSFAYSDVFGEEEGDMADLLEFCDTAAKKSKTKSQVDDSGSGRAREDADSGSDSAGELEGGEDPGSDGAEEIAVLNGSAKIITAHSRGSSSSSDGGSSVDTSRSDGSDSAIVANTRKRKNDVLQDGDIREERNVGPKAGKYVPPGARGRGSAKLRVTRRIRGLLNRVADANASGIADSIIQLFEADEGGVSQDELASIYVTTTLDAVRDGSGVGYINPYIESHAAIASHVGFRVDESILAMVVVSVVRRIDVGLEKLQVQDEDEEIIMADEASAQTDAFGYVVLLCSLYERGAVACTMIYELVRDIAEPFNSERLEILLVLLRQVGAILRQDDPASLKDMIEFIHDQSKKATKEQESTKQEETPNVKLEIMLDLINDIKNNKVKKAAILERKAKFAWAGAPEVPFSASIRDLLDDEFSSKRWWSGDGIVSGETGAEGFNGERPKGSAAVPGRNGRSGDGDPDLASLASSLRLNTEYRKALFKAIMSSFNVSDAVERLERMSGFNSKKNHDRDTALVILHCCGSEKTFNPFYALLAERMCLRSRGLRFTFEFALWDILKSIPGTGKTGPMSKRKARNFCHMLAHLWASGALSLSALRCVSDFEDLGMDEKSFYVEALMLLASKLSNAETRDATAAFKKVRAETWNGAEEFRIGLALFLRRSVQAEVAKAERATVVGGIRLLEGKVVG